MSARLQAHILSHSWKLIPRSPNGLQATAGSCGRVELKDIERMNHARFSTAFMSLREASAVCLRSPGRLVKLEKPLPSRHSLGRGECRA